MFHFIDNLAVDMFYSVTGEGFAERHFVFSECFNRPVCRYKKCCPVALPYIRYGLHPVTLLIYSFTSMSTKFVGMVAKVTHSRLSDC